MRRLLLSKWSKNLTRCVPNRPILKGVSTDPKSVKDWSSTWRTSICPSLTNMNQFSSFPSCNRLCAIRVSTIRTSILFLSKESQLWRRWIPLPRLEDTRFRLDLPQMLDLYTWITRLKRSSSLSIISIWRLFWRTHVSEMESWPDLLDDWPRSWLICSEMSDRDSRWTIIDTISTRQEKSRTSSLCCSDMRFLTRKL